jgi:hypothetical protein
MFNGISISYKMKDERNILLKVAIDFARYYGCSGHPHENLVMNITTAIRVFNNPGVGDVVVNTYRHVLGTTEGDPALEDLEWTLLTRPKILVPIVTLDGTGDLLKPERGSDAAGHYKSSLLLSYSSSMLVPAYPWAVKY